MHIAHLSLTNFRNYTGLEFDFPPRISVFQGANAQGKTNLLESICFLATARFSRSVAERELINWESMSQKLPFAHLSAVVKSNIAKTQIDIILRPRSTVTDEDGAFAAPMQKQIRINGIPRRTSDLLGQLNMVIFSPRDIDLIDGEPALRRRYLDITNSQTDANYLKALQRYNKVLSRRNRLLRSISAHQAGTDELDFWDQELISTGAYIMRKRELAIAELNTLANPINLQLSANRESLQIRYLRSVPANMTDCSDLAAVSEAFRQALRESLNQDIHRGVTSRGPHRDDMAFWCNQANMGTYGSRGQQRTVALALKMAEVRFILEQTGQTPVLLLDDVLSELDAERRRHLLETVPKYEQVLITATDIDRFPPDFLSQAAQFTVRDGQIRSA